MGERFATLSARVSRARLAEPRTCNSRRGLLLTGFGFNPEARLEAPPMRGRHIPVTSIAAESKFVELVRGWLVSLPHDLKIAFDAMDDENLPRPVREVAAGVIAYVVSPNDVVSDRHDAVVSYADDAVLLRIALQKALGKGEDEQSFRERFPELFDGLDENLTLCKSCLGELMTWLESKVTCLPPIEYQGCLLYTS